MTSPITRRKFLKFLALSTATVLLPAIPTFKDPVAVHLTDIYSGPYETLSWNNLGTGPPLSMEIMQTAFDLVEKQSSKQGYLYIVSKEPVQGVIWSVQQDQETWSSYWDGKEWKELE